MSDLVKNWFGPEFQNLHPLIQQLHTSGGVLKGEVTLEYGSGVAGFLGKRLGNKLGLPGTPGAYPFCVSIKNSDERLQWGREFPRSNMVSYFTPVGHYPDGYWREETGAIELRLGVDTENGEWHWVQKELLFKGCRIPAVWFPVTRAYKKIVAGQYHFMVELSYRRLGTLLSYHGILARL